MMLCLPIRKLHRLVCGLFVVFLVLYLVSLIFLDFSTMQDKYKYKLLVMQNLIRSKTNAGQCTIPELPLFSPEMMSFIVEEPPIDCSAAGEDWAQCWMATCSVKPAIVQARGKITCDYSEIVRKDDYSVRYRDAVRTTSDYTLKVSDFVYVKCWDESWAGWSGILFGLREQPRLNNKPPTTAPAADQPTRTDMNVIILGFDSLSRNSFIRKLPKSYAYLTATLGADVLQGYNIVGDGTPQALIPLLTGQTELELPEARRRMPNSGTVDAFPFIWNAFERSGYVTAFNEDLPNVGTFSYRLNGFGAQPTHHYQRTYYVAVQPELRGQPRLCYGQHPRHQAMLNYTRQFLEAYPERAHFAFSFHGELSHDSINLVGVADDDLEQWLRGLNTDGLLENTLLVVMSDHGNRFAEVRDTLQGKLEERLPFFGFVFPEWFKKTHSTEYGTFRGNVGSLVTPFDVHATLMDVLKMQSVGPSQTLPPSAAYQLPKHSTRSLFTEIPASRTCADAFIEPHWCVCLQWHPMADLESELVMRLARVVVEAINGHTADEADKCARLYVHRVTWAAKLSPHDNLLRFKKTNDGDGYLADLADQAMKVSSQLYQVKMLVKPGDSIFEASVQYDALADKVLVDLVHVSRVNKYGEQAACILESNPELRKFCKCKARGDE